MKRFFALSFLAAALALGIWYGLRTMASRETSSETVTDLLPKETLAFVYLPDFRQAREDLHATDLYKLWREPAVQDFLQRPLARLPKSEGARQKIREMDALAMKHAFLAVTAVQENRPKIVGGFHFRGSATEAEKVLGPWRNRLRENLREPKQETVAYQGHKIEVTSAAGNTIATVYDGNWFFLGNDLASLQAVLDRADKRAKDETGTLTGEENFVAAARHMPRIYAALGYARLDRWIEKAIAPLPADAEAKKETSTLRQIRGAAVATTFKEGKIRDVAFVAMPKLEGVGDLARSSLALATKNSFLYSASLLNFSNQVSLRNAGAASPALPAGLGHFLAAMAASGIAAEDWKVAFEPEFGLVGDWPEGARLPAFFATIRVKDAAKARQIVDALTAAAPEPNAWAVSERDGVRYYSQPPPNPMVPVAPTIALSERLLVAGLDAASVEAALQRNAAASSELADERTIQDSDRAGSRRRRKVSATSILALFYARLDAAVRPMLVMAAAFMPAISETVDLGKLPSPEIITNHLSPLVVSQRYEGDGFVVESVGTISVFPAALGAIGASGIGSLLIDRSPPAAFPADAGTLTEEPAPTESATPIDV